MTSRIIRYSFPLLVLAALLASLLPSCGKKAETQSGKPSVVVSIPPLEYFVRAIGGDDVEVECLAPGATDPESFEPSMTQLRRASNADLFVAVGLFPFEEKIADMLTDEKTGLRTVTIKDSVDLIMGTHGHDEADPHVWASYRNARVIAREVEAALEKKHPEAAGAFKQRWAALDARLDSLDRSAAARLAPLRGSAFMIWHPSLSYFARDYGLRQIAVGSEHQELSVNQLKARLEASSQLDARVFFYQQEFDPRQSEVVSAETGLIPVLLSPLSPDIESTLSQAADAIVRGSEKQ